MDKKRNENEKIAMIMHEERWPQVPTGKVLSKKKREKRGNLIITSMQH